MNENTGSISARVIFDGDDVAVITGWEGNVAKGFYIQDGVFHAYPAGLR